MSLLAEKPKVKKPCTHRDAKIKDVEYLKKFDLKNKTYNGKKISKMGLEDIRQIEKELVESGYILFGIDSDINGDKIERIESILSCVASCKKLYCM